VSRHPSLSESDTIAGHEFLIGNAVIVTGPYLPTIRDGAILVRSGQIIDTGITADLRSRYKDVNFVDASGFIVIPGLFNTHTHVAMGFFRGLGHGKVNMIESFLFPAEKSLTPELLEPLSYSYIFDGLRAGVTSFADHYYFSEGIGRAFERFGVRGWLGETVADLGGAFPGTSSWERARKLIEASNFGPLIRHVVAPHAADTVSPNLLKTCADYARKHKLPLHMHLAQTTGESERVQKRDGMTPVMAAHRAGALNQQTLAVHLTSATAEDLRIIKDCGTTIGYCPTSTIIYDRLAPIKTFYELKIPLAIGTDCAASSDAADTLAEIKTAAILGRDHGVRTEDLSPDALLAMSTTIPANVLGVADKLGTLEAGKWADMVFLKTSLSSEPMDEPLANVIWSMGSRDVTHVMVDGKWRLWHKELTGNSIHELRQAYQGSVLEIRRRAGLGTSA
jgi:5-methylthioadenosine/S-adenosylhomocysteine deaminase